MTALPSRERVRRALRHETTDRPPVDFGGTRVSGIGALAYRNLLRHLGHEEDIRVYDVKQQLAAPSLAMIDRMGGDVVQLHRLGPTTGMPFLAVDRWKRGALTDGWPAYVPEALETRVQADGSVEIHRAGSTYAWRSAESCFFDVTWAPLAGACTPAEIDAFVFPDAWSDREEAYLRARVRSLYGDTDKALFAALPMLNCSFFEINLQLFGFEHFMLLLVDDPALVERWLDRQLEHACGILDRYLAIAGPCVEAVQMNDDFGAQTALQIDPAIYRRIFKPRQKRWIEFVKRRTQAKVFLHCDGAIRDILPDFIEIGIDALNPLQTNAAGMEPASLKREFGRDIAFWGGGVETQTTLPFGTVEDVRREVRERLALLTPGGGFVFATIHNIQPDIPPEKVLAVFDTVREWRG